MLEWKPRLVILLLGVMTIASLSGSLSGLLRTLLGQYGW
jgi:hypothetical protein